MIFVTFQLKWPTEARMSKILKFSEFSLFMHKSLFRCGGYLKLHQYFKIWNNHLFCLHMTFQPVRAGLILAIDNADSCINCQFQSSGLFSFENLGWWFILSCVSLPTWLIDDSVSVLFRHSDGGAKELTQLLDIEDSLGPFWLEINKLA